MSVERSGVGYAVVCYVMWGLTPVYWKLLESVGPGEIIGQRVVWSFLFMGLVVVVSGKFAELRLFLSGIFQRKGSFLLLVLASFLISANWGIFMWAVIEERVVEASLGQYVTPIVSMLIGVMFLRERLTSRQWAAFAFAAVGVLMMALQYGSVPWLSLSLALTFGFYGLAKKRIKVNPEVGLTVETLFMLPFALALLFVLSDQQGSAFGGSVSDTLLLMGSGVVTALPLLLFTKGARSISLSLLGILQYVSPTISLAVGVFLFGETITLLHGVAFCLIWLGLAVYSGLFRLKRSAVEV